MTAPLYFALAVAGILGGGVIIASTLGMHWQGMIAILVGLSAFCLGIRDLQRSEHAAPEEPTGNLNGPWRPEDFDSPRIVLASSGLSLFRLPNQIDVDPDGSGFVVGYGDYISPVLIAEQLFDCLKNPAPESVVLSDRDAFLKDHSFDTYAKQLVQSLGFG